MSSPWEPAIPQAMQRHGGSNRSIPKTAQPKPAPSETLPGAVIPDMQQQAREDLDLPVKPNGR
jgi:hypothetical protein